MHEQVTCVCGRPVLLTGLWATECDCGRVYHKSGTRLKNIPSPDFIEDGAEILAGVARNETAVGYFARLKAQDMQADRESDYQDVEVEIVRDELERTKRLAHDRKNFLFFLLFINMTLTFMVAMDLHRWGILLGEIPWLFFFYLTVRDED